MSNRAPHFSNIQGPPFSTLPPVSSMYQQRSNQPHHQQQLQHLQFRGQQRSQPYLQQPRQSIPNHNPAGYPVTVEQYMHKHQHQQAPPVDTRQINPIHDQQKRFDPKKQQFQPVFQSFKATAPQKPISSAFNMSNLTRPYEPKPIIEPASIPAPPPVKKVTSSSSMFSLDSLLSTTFKPADTRKNLNASKRRKSLHNPIKEEKLVFADPDSQEESDQDYKTRRIPQNGKRSRKSPERFNPAKNSAAGLASNRRRRNTDLDGMPSLLNSGTDFIATSNGFISSGYRNVQTVDLPTQAAIDIKEATPDVEVREARIYVFDETRAADIPSIEENVILPVFVI